jgi:hypothetical protein
VAERHHRNTEGVELFKDGRPTWAFWSYSAQIWVGGLAGLGGGIAITLSGRVAGDLYVVGGLFIVGGAALLTWGTVRIVRRLREARADAARQGS